MKIVIPLEVQKDYTELRFALRSFEKYLPEMEIVIVGNFIPDWLTNVTQIELGDILGRKQLSIRSKIIAGLQYAKEKILFMNDDIFLLEPWDEFPYYYHGDLKDYSEAGSRPLYQELIEQNKPVKHFDGHFPIVYDQRFIEASEHFTQDCILKSMYCNYLEIPGTLISDCKIHTEQKQEFVRYFLRDRKCFSTSMYSISSVLFILAELFPDSSKYEI